MLVPRVSYASLGSPKIVQANNTVWADAGCKYSYQMLPNDSISNERWIGTASSEIGIITSSATMKVEYYHQYYITIDVSSSSGGSVSLRSGWYNASSTLSLAETGNPGWEFEGWVGNGTGSYSGSQLIANITISAPITEIATFYPGLAISSSGGGMVRYAYGSASGTVQSGKSITLFLPTGTNLSLSASPDPILNSFHQWSGGSLGDSPQTSIVASGPLTVKASFDYNLQNIDLIALAAVALVCVLLLVVRREKESPSNVFKREEIIRRDEA